MVGFMTVYHREDCPMPRLMFFNSWTSLCIGCQLGALTNPFVSTYLAFRHQTFRGPLNVLLLSHAQPVDQQLHHIMRVDYRLVGAELRRGRGRWGNERLCRGFRCNTISIHSD